LKRELSAADTQIWMLYCRRQRFYGSTTDSLHQCNNNRRRMAVI